MAVELSRHGIRVVCLAPGYTATEADTVNPVNTSAAAPTTWQSPSLSLALTGTDAASGIDHGEWRVNGGTVMNDLVGNIVKHLKKGERIRL